MRVQNSSKMSAAAVLVLAAGLSLTACSGNSNGSGSGGSKDGGANSVPSASTSSGGSITDPGGGAGATATPGNNSGATKGGAGSGRTSGGSGATAHSEVPCRTAHLAFARGSSYTQDDYTHIAIKLTNSGSVPCSLHGFPGVDLVGKDGRVSARRAARTPGTVTLAPGRHASFDLRVLQNNTGGTGVTFTSALITPPDETHPHTLPLTVNLPAQGEGAGAQAVVVGPVTR